MKALVFDIETRDIFDAVKKNPEDLSISVVCAYHEPTNSYSSYTVEELPKLWDLMKEKVDTLVGFNSNHFDIPLLQKYAPFPLSEFHSIDLLEAVKATLGRRIKLDWIAEGTLGIKKSGHGLEAVEWWKRGEVEKIKKYCLDDVKITKEVYQYALSSNTLKYKDFGIVHTIKIDTTPWKRATSPQEINSSLF